MRISLISLEGKTMLRFYRGKLGFFCGGETDNYLVNYSKWNLKWYINANILKKCFVYSVYSISKIFQVKKKTLKDNQTKRKRISLRPFPFLESLHTYLVKIEFKIASNQTSREIISNFFPIFKINFKKTIRPQLW